MNISVALSSGKFVRAQVVSRTEIEDGITICAIRSISGTGAFSAIHEQTGATVCRGKWAREALSKARDLILHRKEVFLASVANLPPAPAPDGLMAVGAAPKVSRVAKAVMKLDVADAIIAMAEKVGDPLCDDAKGGILRALSSTNGKLKAKAPTGPWAKAAWLGIQPNPFKISVGACLMLPQPQRALLERLSAIRFPSALDADREALERMGAW